MDKQKNDNWWKSSVFYQIYPRSFADSTNNGIGDLRGIINRLNYLRDLNIDAIWLSPFYPSPQQDFGYDITDYCSINPEYGTIEDFKELLELSHSFGLKIIIDLVLNHTSDKHPWFIESSSNNFNDKKDWYIWKKGRGRNNDLVPNNWKSLIGGSAWEWHEKRQEFYFHQFFPFQPDLNWRNIEVQQKMFNIIKYWLNLGVDGFRLDIIHTLFENEEFLDNPRSFRLFPSHDTTSYLLQQPKYTQFLPETVDMCKQLKKLVNSYFPERILVGEAVGGPKVFSCLYGSKSNNSYNDGLNMVFNFKIKQPFSANRFKKVIKETEDYLKDPFWPCYVFSNHDVKRMISFYGNHEKKARIITLLLLTLRGTPFIYMGEELGMKQVKMKKKHRKDTLADLVIWKLPIGAFFGRDGCRTPMQWSENPINAGFSNNPYIEPWLPISKESSVINVDYQLKTSNSFLNFYKNLLYIRKEHKSLIRGELKLITLNNKNCLCYERRKGNESTYILINFSKKYIRVMNPIIGGEKIFSTNKITNNLELENNINLGIYEGIIMKLP